MTLFHSLSFEVLELSTGYTPEVSVYKVNTRY